MAGSRICEHTTRSDGLQDTARAEVDVSPDVDLSGAGSPKVKTPVHTVAVYDQYLPPRAAVTFSQVITPPAGLKDATPKPLEAVDGGALADGAETSRLENEGKVPQVAVPMSKSQGPAGDHINAKIILALGTAALNCTEKEDLRREVAEPATELVEAQRQLHCKINVLPTAMSHGRSPTIKQPDPMVKIKTSQPTQGKSTESPQVAMTDTPAPTPALADAIAKMEAAQLALETLDARYSGRAGAMPWCEHFNGIGVEWQWMEMGRKTVESSLIYTVARTSDQDDTKGKAQRSMAVRPLYTPMVDLPAQGMPKGNLPTVPTAPVAPTLTLAGTQAAADNSLEAGHQRGGQAACSKPGNRASLHQARRRYEPSEVRHTHGQHARAHQRWQRQDDAARSCCYWQQGARTGRGDDTGGVCLRHQHARLQNTGGQLLV